MTLEEAKKILKKEVFGIRFKKFDKPLKFEEKLWIRNEKPEVLEALHIVAKNGIGVSVPETTLRIRRLIIKKMKAGEGEPAPVSGTPLTAAEGMKLQWKDNKNTDKNPALAESASQFNDALLDEQAKKIAEKDEVIDNLRKELKAQKGLVNHISKKYDGAKINLNLRMKECEKLKEALEEKTNLVEMVRKGSKEYREYGIEAVKMIRKMAKVIVSYKPVVSLKDFKEYRRLANGYSFNPQLFDFSEEEEKKLSLIRDDSVGAVTNQKNYSPFKDTHPTEESPEEVELDEILELFVRL